MADRTPSELLLAANCYRERAYFIRRLAGTYVTEEAYEDAMVAAEQLDLMAAEMTSAAARVRSRPQEMSVAA